MSLSKNKIGAIMVVGGGLAGLQAALDAADLGYLVYLVEQSAVLGGEAVPWSKTNPASYSTACAICSRINLVQCHQDIETFLQAEVTDLEGELGRLKAMIRMKEIPGKKVESTSCPPKDSLPVKAGEMLELEIGAVILACGRDYPSDFRNLLKSCGILLTSEGLVATSVSNPVASSRPGVYACGAIVGARDHFDALYQAAAAAGAAAASLSDVRSSRIHHTFDGEERDPGSESPCLGIFICQGGFDQDSANNAEELVAFAAGLPFVEYAKRFDLVCSPENQAAIKTAINSKKLNRLVAACHSKELQNGIFQGILRPSGIESHLCRTVDIRPNGFGVPWTQIDKNKAKNLIRDAADRLAFYQPLNQSPEWMNKPVLVVGGNFFGLIAALFLAEQGFPAYLVEQSAFLGGDPLFWEGLDQVENIEKYLRDLISKIQEHPLVKIYREATILGSSGYYGNFTTKIRTSEAVYTLDHGLLFVPGGTPPAIISADLPSEGIVSPVCLDQTNSLRHFIVLTLAAATRAAAILIQDDVLLSGIAAEVTPDKCAVCLTCVRTCPCGVPFIGQKGHAEIDPVICRGCGQCMAECPGRAISLKHFSDNEMLTDLELFQCSLCGQPYLSRARLKYLKRKYPNRDLKLLERSYCPACARLNASEKHAWIVDQT